MSSASQSPIRRFSRLHRGLLNYLAFRTKSASSLVQLAALATLPLLALFSGVCLRASPAAAQAQGARTTPAASASVGGDVQNGKQVFAMEGCNKCHGGEGQGLLLSERQDAGPRIGPTRLGLPAFLTFVRNPSGKMVPFGTGDVSDAALTDVYAFLQSLAPATLGAAAATGNAQSGQRLFHDYGCYECHGSQGQGSSQTGGSRIGPPPIEFSSFLSYLRQPTNQMPPYSATAMRDAQVADIYAYLKSIPAALPAKSIPLLNQ